MRAHQSRGRSQHLDHEPDDEPDVRLARLGKVLAFYRGNGQKRAEPGGQNRVQRRGQAGPVFPGREERETARASGGRRVAWCCRTRATAGPPTQLKPYTAGRAPGPRRRSGRGLARRPCAPLPERGHPDARRARRPDRHRGRRRPDRRTVIARSPARVRNRVSGGCDVEPSRDAVAGPRVTGRRVPPHREHRHRLLPRPSTVSPLGMTLPSVRDRDYLLERSGVIFKVIGDYERSNGAGEWPSQIWRDVCSG